MGWLSSRALKLTAAGIGVVLLLAVTVNVVADFWTPPIELKQPAVPVQKPVVQIAPVQPQKMPEFAPPNERQASAPAELQWNLPVYEPKFDIAPASRGGSVGAMDFSRASGPSASVPEVLPPALPGSDSAPGISFHPIFGSKAGGVEGSVTGAANNLPGVGNATGGAASTAGSLLKR